MVYDLANKEIVHRFKGTPSISGNQYYFNIPVFAIRNKYIDAVKEYWIYIVENKPPTIKKSQLKSNYKKNTRALKKNIEMLKYPAS